jgi:hypothetical protein
MANRTLLNGVNEVLKKLNLIQGDSGSLASLTDSARQIWVDSIVQLWNEVMEDLYSTSELPMPQELGEDTITLATNTRAYALSAYNTLYWPLMDETNGTFIYEWEGGYLDLVASQPVPADFTGMPYYGVIEPTDGKIYLDRIPTASENGLVYKYRYDKDVSVSAATDTFPFKDSVFRALVPAVAERWKLDNRGEFAEGLYKEAIGTASRQLSGRQMRSNYMSGGAGPDLSGIFSPFAE